MDRVSPCSRRAPSYDGDMSLSAQELTRPALIVIDVQKGFDDSEFWGPRDNLACETNIVSLVAHWRIRQWPLVFVQHESDNQESPLASGSPGGEFKDFITGAPDLLVRKKVNSSFYGTPDLDAWLRTERISQVVICGITTNHCCETTARMAGNLGYETYFAIDATHTFDRSHPDGTTVPATTLSMVTSTNLDGEFATVVDTVSLLQN